MQVDGARSSLCEFDVSTACACPHRRSNFAGPHIARTGLQTKLSGKLCELDVSRAALQIGVAASAFNDLVPGAAMRANRSVGGDRGFVIHRNVSRAYDLGVEAVFSLPQPRPP